MPRLLSKRFTLAALGVVLGVLVVVAVADVVSGGRFRLGVEYRVQEGLTHWAKATELRIDPLPPFKMFLHPGDKVITYGILSTGVWEPNETRWTMRLVRKGDTYVDIGANVGYYTVLASLLVGEEGRVFAFEPDPVNFSILEKNVRLNGLTNVVLEQKAVSNEKGSIKLFLAEENKGAHSIGPLKEGGISIDVEAVRLDDYFADYDRSIDFVKIDTQGAEGVILEGMAEVIGRNDDIIMAVEFSPFGLSRLGYESEALLKLLRSHDFLFYRLGSGGNIVKDLRIVDEPFLRLFTLENKAFTNLMVVKGFREGVRIAQPVADAKRALSIDTPELVAALRQWETEAVEMELDAANVDSSLPENVVAALRTESARRSAAEVKAIEDYFASVTSLLADARVAHEAALADLDHFQTSIWESHGRTLVGSIADR